MLAAQAESVEGHTGEVANVEKELDGGLERICKVTREVASSAHQGLVAPLGATASVGEKVNVLEGALRELVHHDHKRA